jgi:hypothetical protein
MNGEDAPPAKLRQLIVQAAKDEHWPSALSQGFAACGQQSSIGSSIDSWADIAVMSCGFDLNPAVPVGGSKATDRAIKNANMIRAKTML